MRILIGRVRTVAPPGLAEAIAIDGERIVAVGEEAQVRAAAGNAAKIEDLGDRCVLPGFIDVHHHMCIAVVYHGATDCKGARSMQELRDRLAAAAATTPKERWVVGAGYDAWNLRERRHPTRDDLDAACPDHPTFLQHYSGHQGVANTRALELAEIGRETKDPPAGEIIRGPAGEPTGVLYETAFSPVEALAIQDLAAVAGEAFFERLVAYQRGLLALGLTRIADPCVSPRMEERYREARRRGALLIPIVMMPVGSHGYLVPPRDRLDGPPTGEGDDDLRIGPLKVFFDGSDKCAICMTVKQAAGALGLTVREAFRLRSRAPLRALRRGKLRWCSDFRARSGMLFFEHDGAAQALIDRARERGFGLAIHAVGNEASAMASRVLSGGKDDKTRPRIEHLCFVDDEAVRRMAGEGIRGAVQPPFIRMLKEEELPRIPGLPFNPFRKMLDGGLVLAASSDHPVTTGDPLVGLRAAVSRRGASDQLVDPDQAVTIEEAIAMYTRDAADTLGVGDQTGTLEPGKRADLVVFSHDPHDTLDGLKVERTYVAGRQVHPQTAEPRGGGSDKR